MFLQNFSTTTIIEKPLKDLVFLMKFIQLMVILILIHLYEKMNKKNYRVSRATLYNTIELLLESGLVRKHQFGESFSQYEKCYFNNQHDHIIITDTGEVKEFCDPRIQSIKNDIEKIFNVDIEDHSLYLYATSKKKKNR
jgi:Fur family ferric uptake transcriptional regulator